MTPHQFLYNQLYNTKNLYFRLQLNKRTKGENSFLYNNFYNCLKFKIISHKEYSNYVICK